MGIAVLGARILIGSLEPGTYRRGGTVHLRVWLAERLGEASGAENQAGAPWLVYYARALGNKVGKGVDLHSAPPVTGMLTLGHRCSIEPEVDLTGHWIDGDLFHVGPITVGNDATIGARTTLLPNAVVGKNADVAPGSGVVGKVKAGQYWKGSPAMKSGKARHPWPDERPRRAPFWVAVYGVTSDAARRGAAGGARRRIWPCSAGPCEAHHVTGGRDRPAGALDPGRHVVAVFVYAALTVVGVRMLALGLREGYHPVRSRVGWQLWATERLMDAARNYLFPDLRQPAHPVVAAAARREDRQGYGDLDRLAHPEVHRRGGRRLPGRRHHGRVLRTRRRMDPRREGHRRQAGVPRQLGYHPAGPTGARRRTGRRAQRDAAQGQGRIVVVGQSADPTAPQAHRRRRAAHLPPVVAAEGHARGGRDVPHRPPDRDVRNRCRRCSAHCRPWPTNSAGCGQRLAGGVVLLVAGAVAGTIAVVAKWLVIGRITAIEHPLWSSFVWRNEVSDTFVETVAAPWFARAASGTPVMNLWLRALGASIGRGVWCETYWLPRGRPGQPRPRRDGEPGVCGADPPVPRPHHAHGHRGAGGRRDARARTAWRCPRPGSAPARRWARPRSSCGATRCPPSTRWQGNPIAPWNAFRKKRGGAPKTPKDTRGIRRVTRSAKKAGGQERSDRGKARARKSTPPVIDPYLPGNGNFGYRVSRYELDLEYKVNTNRLSGAATITAATLAVAEDVHARPRRRPHGVQGVGQRPAARPVPPFRAASCTSRWSSALPAGAAMSITVRYAGNPRPIRSLWGEVGFEELTNGALVAGQPNGAASWFPCDDHPSSKASYRIQISTDNPYRAVANGELVSRRTRAAMTTWVYEQAEPTSTYLVTLQIGEYDAHRLAKSPVPMNAALPPTLAAQLRSRLRPTAPDDEALRQAVRALPTRGGLHRRGDRRRARDSA